VKLVFSTEFAKPGLLQARRFFYERWLKKQNDAHAAHGYADLFGKLTRLLSAIKRHQTAIKRYQTAIKRY